MLRKGAKTGGRGGMQEKRVVHEEREMKREGGQERNRQTGAKRHKD